MTERELKKLSRADLIEMLLVLSKENAQLRSTLALAEEQLADRIIKTESVGSLAEAALALNGVFEAAQAASEQYLYNIRLRSEQQNQINARLELETREKCERMLQAAKQQADEYLKEANSKCRKFSDTYSCQVDLTGEPLQAEV